MQSCFSSKTDFSFEIFAVDIERQSQNSVRSTLSLQLLPITENKREERERDRLEADGPFRKCVAPGTTYTGTDVDSEGVGGGTFAMSTQQLIHMWCDHRQNLKLVFFTYLPA